MYELHGDDSMKEMASSAFPPSPASLVRGCQKAWEKTSEEQAEKT